jgi:hypothetical protein
MKIPLRYRLIVLFFCWPTMLWAEPIAQFTVNEKTRIVLHSEPCKLKGQIENLPGRAVWEESGKIFEGCWGFDGKFGMMWLYFSDKTVVGFPVREMQRLTGV